jgi:hypothetical protein
MINSGYVLPQQNNTDLKSGMSRYVLPYLIWPSQTLGYFASCSSHEPKQKVEQGEYF